LTIRSRWMRSNSLSLENRSPDNLLAMSRIGAVVTKSSLLSAMIRRASPSRVAIPTISSRYFSRSLSPIDADDAGLDHFRRAEKDEWIELETL
jgi:hypothetical protein